MKTLEITSKDNSTFKSLKLLLTSRGIKDEKCFFFVGEKLIQDFIKKPNPHFKIKNVVTFENGPDLVISDLQIKLKKELFNELDILGTHYPLLILEYKPVEEFNFQIEPAGLEIISPLGDPKNLGALVRSAVAFGASKIILTQESCHPYLPHVIKSSAGSILNISIFVSPLKINQIAITGSNFGLDLNGTALTKIEWPKNLRLLIGEEGPGLNLSHEQTKKIKMIHIPMASSIESLNATVSASITMWHWLTSKV